MPETPTPGQTPEPAMRVVVKPSENGFAPRTRKSTSEALTALTPALDSVKADPGKVYTVVEGVTPAKSASLVNLLNEHYDKAWTFGARSTPDGSAIVQAMYDPSKPRVTRTVARKAPGATKAPAAKAPAAAKTGGPRR